MKRILIIAIAIVCAVSCYPKQNNIVDDNTVTPEAEEMVSNAAAQKDSVDVSNFKKGHVIGVDRYGHKNGVCIAYYGEFNGHTWYVFYDNLAVPAVVHDPLCACGGGK